MKSIEIDGRLVCYPTGRIDSTNSAAFEQELSRAQTEHPGLTLVLDAEGLEYISSAGLRVLLRQRQAAGELTVRNASQALYDIFDITGFTAMIKVEKAMRFVSVNGLEVLGSGIHSTVYRLDEETILKVVKDMSLDAIRTEMQVSKQVYIHGIPTAISYDVVRTEEGYGEVYEMFHAGVLPAAIMAEPERLGEYLRRFTEMYKSLHAVEIDENELDNVHDRYLAAADQAAPYMTAADHEALRRFLLAIPQRHTFVHGDFHMGNVMLQDGELVLIDVGEAGWGHPLLDFAQTMLAYTSMTTIRKQNCRRILGVEVEQALYIRENLLPLYFGETGEALARKRTVIDAMRRVRLLLICFLQGWDHMPSDFDDILADARANVFSRVDELCALIAIEF
jgi:uncharacterized protein (TIGR02172 family)